MSALSRTSVAMLSTWLLVFSASGQTTQPLPGLTVEQTAKLLRCRAIIENEADSESTRRSQAEELLQTGWSPALDTLAELLGTSGDGAAAGIVAKAIASVGRDHPERLDSRLVEPLLRLVSEVDPAVAAAATAALSNFRNREVIERLGRMTADTRLPLRVRLSAIDGLAPNIDLRPAIAQLVPLLSAPEADITERALAALAPASRTNFGRNVDEWRRWWAEKAGMDDASWLRDRVDLLSQRNRDLQAQLEQTRHEHEARYNTLAKRLSDVLRMNLRLTPQQAEKDALLVGWLRDPLVDLRLAAVALLAEQIYDQQKPADTVRAALRERYADPSVQVRRQALELVGALSDPADVEPVLLRLAVEHDVDVRETILGVLGKLRNPAAISVLIDEIADNAALANCVTRAAQSLAVLARETPDPAALSRAIAPLRARLASLEGGDPRAAGALLAAMASIASPDCAASFVEFSAKEDPEVLLPAIRGLVTLGDRSQLARIRTLMGHADPRVRTQAIEAIGSLGGDVADLEALLSRLSAAGEPNEPARAASWSAFCRLIKNKSADVRLVWAERLKELPELHIEYMVALVESLSASASPGPELWEAKDQLATLLLAQKRYTEATRCLEELFDRRTADGAASSVETGLRLLDATLRSGKQDRLDVLLPRLALLGETARTGVVSTISAYLGDAMKGTDNSELGELVSRIERASGTLYGEDFRKYLNGVRERLAVPATESPTPRT